MNGKVYGTTELHLPAFKSNIPNDKVFTNNTNFVSNTKAFYDDLNRKLDSNEKILEQICIKSIARLKNEN